MMFNHQSILLVISVTLISLTTSNLCIGGCPKGFSCSDGICQDICIFIKNVNCGNCFRGQCGVTNLCSLVSCPTGSKCVDGECIRGNDRLCLPAIFERKRCSYIRPRYCPIINTLVPVPPTCGQNYSGRRKTFHSECFACKDYQTLYTYNVDCADVYKVCKPTQYCRDGKCIDLCANITCPINTKCVLGNCVPL